jgi:hypothetical protein
LLESMRVKAQLENILSSSELGSAPSLQRFLRHVVEETLAGRGDALKEYCIGSVVFGRGQDFNPKVDPIVRVQARNVRARLEQYYAGAGARDPVIIELPKGTYVPVFRMRERPAPRRGWLVTALTVAAAVVVLVGAAIFEAHRQRVCVHAPQATRQYLSP